jgi:hypothetical protein
MSALGATYTQYDCSADSCSGAVELVAIANPL